MRDEALSWIGGGRAPDDRRAVRSWAARRGGEPGRQRVQADVEHGLELAVRLAAELRRRALLPGPPGGDQDGRRVATGYQVSEEFDLLWLQRCGGDVPRQDLVRELQTVVATAEHVGRRHREVADECRVRHVPEVGDADDRQRVVDEHVGGGQVVVHDLGAHPEQLRSDPLLEAVEHGTHRRTPRLVDRREPRPQLREAPYVPGDGVRRGLVYEPAKRLPQAGRCTPPLTQLRRTQLLRSRMPAVQPRHHPGQGATAIEPGQRHPPMSLVGSPRRRARARPGATVRMWRRAEHWRSNTSSPSAGLCTFEQVTTSGRVDPEVPVTFPVNGGELTLKAPEAAQRIAQRGQIENRRGHGEWIVRQGGHRTILAVR